MPKPICPRLRRAFLGLLLPLLLLACGNAPETRERPEAFAPQRTSSATESTGSRRAPDLAASWLEVAILNATNARRRQQDRPRLQAEERLADIARTHSESMLKRRFFDHVDPDGLSPAQRVARGHRTLVGISGENLWTGSGYQVRSREEAEELAETIVSGWMASQGHRENILRREFDHLGVGVVVDGSEFRATQVFAGVVAWLDAPLPERLRSGDEVRIQATASGDFEQAELWDLAPLEGGEAFGPWEMGETVELERGALEDGERYQLRLYLLTEVERLRKRYEIFSGPEVVVE